MFMEPIYKWLIEHGVKILVYSGDDDGVRCFGPQPLACIVYFQAEYCVGRFFQ
jgi:hypothetical protein